jgi:hypothetical protein
MDWAKVHALAAIAAVISTFLAPLFALQVSALLARRRDRYQRKFELFQTLMRWRAVLFVEQPVQALNLIDVLFHDVRNVRDAWEELHAAFIDTRLNTLEGGRVRLDKTIKLLRAMADHLGYSKEFSTADFERVYNPEVLGRFYMNQIAQTNQAYEQLFAKQAAAGAPAPGPPPASLR